MQGDTVMKKTEQQDWRYAQANKEALLSLGMYAFYFIWWYVCAYGLGEGDPSEYTYILGLPSWFFLSCIAGYPLLSFLLWVMVKVFFKDMPLDDEDASTPESGSPNKTSEEA